MKNSHLISYQKNVKIKQLKIIVLILTTSHAVGKSVKKNDDDGFRSFSHLRPEGCTCRSNWGNLGRENDPGRGGGSGAK
jgi:hypothetical protein